MNARETIALDFGHMHDGETRAGELCPACKGGETGEGSLSVTKREGVLLWQCHRASCGFKGATGSSVRHSGNGYHTRVPETRGAVGREILRSAEAVPPEIVQRLLSDYAINRAHISRCEIGWDTDTSRLALPVQNLRSERLGVVLRALDGRKPKTLNHTEKDAIAWYPNHSAGGVIIVEDQLSAIRASDFLTSVALLGTHLNDERAAEIRASGLRPVYLALDADAWGKAVKYAVQYRGVFQPQLLRISKDLKNHTDQELRELFHEHGIGNC